MLVANYFGGSVAVLPMLPDGRLGDATDIKNDAGKIGPTKATNAPPGSFAFSGHDRTHAHMIQADASGRFVLHVDLGLDKIFVWKFDEQKGVLTPNDPPAVSLPPGDGPRHFHFHPNGRWFYSIQEEGSTIVLFDYDAATGRLTPRQTISTLPPGFAGSNFCSEILVSADGRFVYAGNRLHDSIGIFSVGPNGELTFVGEEWTRGDYPRSFNFDPTGQFLYCCNQRGDNIAVFQVNRKTGGLKFTGHYAPVGNPSMHRLPRSRPGVRSRPQAGQGIPEDPNARLRSGQGRQVDGALVEGGEAGDPVETGGRMVADIDGQLEAGDVRRGQLEGVRQDGAAEAAAAGGGGQAEVGDLPRVAVGDLGQEHHRRGRRLGAKVAHLPALGDEPAARAVAGQDVVERTNPLQLGHVETAGIGRLQDRAEVALGRGPEPLPVERRDLGPDVERDPGGPLEVDQLGNLGHPPLGQVRGAVAGPTRRAAPAR